MTEQPGLTDKDRLSQEAAENMRLMLKVAELERKLREQAAERTAYETDVNATLSQAMGIWDALEEKNRATGASLTAETGRADDNEEKARVATARNRELEAQNRQLAEELAEKERQIALLIAQVQQLEATNRHLVEQVADLRGETNAETKPELVERNKQLRAERDELLHTVAGLESKIGELEQQVDSLEREIQMRSRRPYTAGGAYREHITQVEHENAEALALIDKLTRELTELRALRDRVNDPYSSLLLTLGIDDTPLSKPNGELPANYTSPTVRQAFDRLSLPDKKMLLEKLKKGAARSFHPDNFRGTAAEPIVSAMLQARNQANDEVREKNGIY